MKIQNNLKVLDDAKQMINEYDDYCDRMKTSKRRLNDFKNEKEYRRKRRNERNRKGGFIF